MPYIYADLRAGLRKLSFSTRLNSANLLLLEFFHRAHSLRFTNHVNSQHVPVLFAED